MGGKLGTAGTVGIARTDGISLYPGIGALRGLAKGVLGARVTSTIGSGMASPVDLCRDASEEVHVPGVVEMIGNRGFLTDGASVKGGGRFLTLRGESARGGVYLNESGEAGRPVIPDPLFVGVTTVSDSVDEDHGCVFLVTVPAIREGRGGLRTGSSAIPKSTKLSSFRCLPCLGLASVGLVFGRVRTEVNDSIPHLPSPGQLSAFAGGFVGRGRG
jgi:hypothetical protein